MKAQCPFQLTLRDDLTESSPDCNVFTSWIESIHLGLNSQLGAGNRPQQRPSNEVRVTLVGCATDSKFGSPVSTRCRYHRQVGPCQRRLDEFQYQGVVDTQALPNLTRITNDDFDADAPRSEHVVNRHALARSLLTHCGELSTFPIGQRRSCGAN